MSGDWIHTVYRSVTRNWANQLDSGERVFGVHATKQEAVRRGQELARAAQTNHVVHDIDGRTGSSVFYGDEPVSPRR